MKGEIFMKKLTTGVILGGVVVGATASVISNMDRRTVKKMKRTNNNNQNHLNFFISYFSANSILVSSSVNISVLYGSRDSKHA